ncbi:hypothetical protein [Emticicia sp. C21]|uniref:hypothetical protein n=1 Tax=Emticicia sp. C21 TaxID=2302915 RepID=UPI000E350122|nr:hypothetical protein [Emticicia sp. C21]RFS17024.1 hypothetical protein D0T08_10120 [Emticicia sp. C21]
MKIKKLLITIVIFVCIGFGIFYLVAMFMTTALIDGDNKEFNQNLWKDDFEGETRAVMLSDLENKHLKKGMTKDEVIKLLGEPDGRHPDGENYTWKKELGYDLGNSFDPCEFIIYLDENLKVVSWKKYCS